MTLEELEKMQKEDLSDYVKALETDWRENNRRKSEAELLKIYPAVIDIIPEKLRELKNDREEVVLNIKSKLVEIEKTVKEDFSKWFCREFIKYIDGVRLVSIDSQISRFKRLKFLSTHTEIKTKGRITEEQIQEALVHPIENIVSQITKLRRSGRDFIALCLLHTEKTPSFHIFTKTNTFWCFGCNKGGNSINLARLLYGYSFTESVHFLRGGSI